MGTAPESEMTYKERLRKAVHHNKQMVAALEMSDQAFQKAMKDIESMRVENASLKAQLEAQQKNNELLGKKLNETPNHLQDRVVELIGFCRQHGIDPDTGEKKT